jgi:DNA-binding PadR family transcriptional regulator
MQHFHAHIPAATAGTPSRRHQCHSGGHRGRPADQPHHGGGRGRGSSDDGSGAFMRGRKFSSEDLQLMLLALLAERASHGYELIKELQTRSGGFYSPSPGMIYPALTYIEELGYAAVAIASNKKSYSLLPAGHVYLNAHRTRVDELLAGLIHMARKMQYLRGAIAEESSAGEREGWLPVFVEARLALKRTLLLKSAAAPDEQRRIAAILARATEEILAHTPPPQTPDATAN